MSFGIALSPRARSRSGTSGEQPSQIPTGIRSHARVSHALLAAHRAAEEMMGSGVIQRDVFTKAMEVAANHRHGFVTDNP